MNSIKKYREEAGLTQDELASRVGVSSSGIVSMWETGVRTPRAATLIALSKALGCTVDELLKGGEE